MTVPIVGMEGICDLGTEAVKDLPGEFKDSLTADKPKLKSLHLFLSSSCSFKGRG